MQAPLCVDTTLVYVLLVSLIMEASSLDAIIIASFYRTIRSAHVSQEKKISGQSPSLPCHFEAMKYAMLNETVKYSHLTMHNISDFCNGSYIDHFIAVFLHLVIAPLTALCGRRQRGSKPYRNCIYNRKSTLCVHVQLYFAVKT